MANSFAKITKHKVLQYAVKWLTVSSIVGVLSGLASGVFLHALNWAKSVRDNNLWIIALLPIAGFLIGWVYERWGKSVVRGNNQLLEEYYVPQQKIPFKMAPLVFFGTILTHLFGGSAGREGTAVQMGGAISDQFSSLFKLNDFDRKIILVIGISAGFASVFGTPLAGAVFAMEVLVLTKARWEAIIPSLITAYIANVACDLTLVEHTHYSISEVPILTTTSVSWAAFSGLIFGLGAMLFAQATHFWGRFFNKRVAYGPFRPLIGGVVIAAAVFLIGTTKYIGLGVPTIVASFTESMNSYDFLLKILFTSFTLGAGFKGGEVTPLFYVGATLGNALVWFVPLPVSLMAGMGFVAVFSGATNTPIACTIMGLELFGIDGGVYIAIACFTAYLSSGYTGIYSSQLVAAPKYWLYPKRFFKKKRAVK